MKYFKLSANKLQIVDFIKKHKNDFDQNHSCFISDDKKSFLASDEDMVIQSAKTLFRASETNNPFRFPQDKKGFQHWGNENLF